jgi:hypothetical protein
MKKLLRRYRAFLIAVVMMILVTLFNRQLGLKAIGISGYSIKEMIMIIPPIFVLLGLLDVWVPRETMMKYMGEGSGFKGLLLAITRLLIDIPGIIIIAYILSTIMKDDEIKKIYEDAEKFDV